MKKLILFVSLLLTLVVAFALTPAFASEYADKTEEELHQELDLIRNELTARGLIAEDKTVIVDQDGFQMYINGSVTVDKKYSWDTENTLMIPVVAINDTNSVVNVSISDSSVNGWSSEGSTDVYEVPAGKKAKGILYFELTDTDVEELSEFTDVEFKVRVYDDDTWDNLFETEAITIYTDQK